MRELALLDIGLEPALRKALSYFESGERVCLDVELPERRVMLSLLRDPESDRANGLNQIMADDWRWPATY